MKRKRAVSKSSKPKSADLLRGFKVVSPPKSARRRKWLEGADIETSGGARSGDAMILRRRLDEMRRRGEKPLSYERVREELGLK